MSTDAPHTSSAAPGMVAMLLIAAIALALSTLRPAPAPVETGDTVDAAIMLALDSGEVVFDERRTITLREGVQVPGLHDAIVGMPLGEEQRFEIPPERAYGARGRGDIPPNATLTATVEILRVLERAD